MRPPPSFKQYAGGRRAIESSWARQGVVDGNAGGAGRKTGEEWQWCGWCVRDCESKLEGFCIRLDPEEMKVGGDRMGMGSRVRNCDG